MSPSPTARVGRRFRTLAFLTSALLVWSVAVVAADAASFKPYGIENLPGKTGAQPGSVTLQLDNLTSTQQLGSFQVSVSSGFTITPTSAGGSSLSPTRATFQNLNIPAGGTGSVSFTVSAPCGASTVTWGFSAQQSNQWQSGNNANYMTLAQVVYADDTTVGNGTKAVTGSIASSYLNTGCTYDVSGVPGVNGNTSGVSGGGNAETFTVSNVTGGTLTSVTVAVSSPYTITVGSTTSSSATIPVGASGTGSLSFTLDAPCSGGGVTWTFTANPSAFSLANVNGSPAPATISTPLASPACEARFSAADNGVEVADAEVSTGPSYNPDTRILSAGLPGAGLGVKVGLYGLADSSFVTVPQSVSLSLSGGSGPLGGTSSAPTTDGTATFTGLTVGSEGTSYALVASSANSSSDTSNTFAVVSILQPCDPNKSTCTVDFAPSNGDSRSSITAYNPTAGSYYAGGTNPAGLTISCAFSPFDYADDYDPNTTVYTYTGPGSKTVVLTIDKSWVQQTPNNGTSFYQVCYAAPTTFDTRIVTGYDSAGAYDGVGTYAVPILASTDPAHPNAANNAGNNATDLFGTTWYVGTLPACADVGNVAPCLQSKAGTGGNRVLTFITPPGDPGYK